MYKIKKIRRGYIVINTSTGKHAHFRSLFGCKCIIHYLTNNIEITNPYLQVSEVEVMNYLKRFSIKFYKTKTWQNKRDEILERDNYECQMCKDKGRYTSATTVHHIQHYKDCPELALTDSNLVSLCDACHNVVHPEKLESVHKKKEIHKEKWE